MLVDQGLKLIACRIGCFSGDPQLRLRASRDGVGEGSQEVRVVLRGNDAPGGQPDEIIVRKHLRPEFRAAVGIRRELLSVDAVGDDRALALKHGTGIDRAPSYRLAYRGSVEAEVV